MAKWIYDGDCYITTCCNAVYDINKFEQKGDMICLPCKCPNCNRYLESPDDFKRYFLRKVGNNENE